MRKFWIFMAILFAIVFGIAIACAVSDAFKVWFGASMFTIFGQTVVTIGDWWTNISLHPLYQQWHMLIWFAGGVIGTVIFAKILWPRRPKLFQPKAVAPQDYQHVMEPSLPQSIVEPVPQNIAKPKPAVPVETKQEEAVTP